MVGSRPYRPIIGTGIGGRPHTGTGIGYPNVPGMYMGLNFKGLGLPKLFSIPFLSLWNNLISLITCYDVVKFFLRSSLLTTEKLRDLILVV
jgi:hypothetical protein